ncbi:ATP-binding protein [Halobacteria archaeon AArc-m2/3/4]|uniref:ATP-binding protein n=1 Tax=Natronoglomus mannanivorans TaxID=2979990 RepID=A0AAP3E3Q4_9EURY|nr:ATP-binding protein [Halobacteria archaeon AArc-xg1-1]MCU4972119.1 ATP-binding protein [Halobacteria archaeon AArc-m2/3/4]
MAVTSLLFVLALCSGIASIVCGVLVSRRWHKPGADWFVVCVVGAVCWSFAYAAGMLVSDPAVRWVFEIPIWVGHGIVPVAFLLFVLRYTGRVESLSAVHHLLLWTIPLLTVVAVLTNDVHHLMWSNFQLESVGGAATVYYDKGPWLYVHKLYSYVLIAGATIVLVQMLAARDSLYTAQAGLLVAVSIPLVAGSLLWLFEVGPYPQVTLTPLLFGPVFAVATLVLFRSTLFDSAPAARRIGKRRVIDDFDDSVVLLDDTDRIVDANDAAERTLETERDELVGEFIDTIVPETSTGVEPGRFTARLESAAGYRTYEITISTVSDGRGNALGHSLVFHDITTETQRRQRLSVLNRVLRHNLRNDLNVIQSYAAQLEGRVEHPDDELVSVIVEQSAKLATLGEKARRIERTLDTPGGTPGHVSIASVITSVVDNFDETDATFSITVGDRSRSRDELREDGGAEDIEFLTYRSILETVLEDAVENAVVHGGECPSIRIAATRREDSVELVVTDDGPGIPEVERTPLETGTETALEHGSGLGLWLIAWGTSQLGGSVTFTNLDGERGGAEVRFQLPTSPESE